MAWNLEIWFGYDGWLDAESAYYLGVRRLSGPTLEEAFDTKNEGVTRAQELLADGYTVTVNGVYHHFPASAITHVMLKEYEPEE